MKLYLDDERIPPDGWVLVATPEAAIETLKTGNVTHLSLDHDLGLLQSDGQIDDGRTGYTVLQWLEEAVVTQGFTPPEFMQVHSANPAGARKMELAISSIRRLAERFSNR